MNSDFVNVNEYLPLRDVVFQTIRQAILTGEFAPGERLMEIHLANRLGVSRTPVREAMRRLELEGLVLMLPRKGAVVADITAKDLKDVLEVRRTLEMMAVELACDRIHPEQKEELDQAMKHFSAMRDEEDLIKVAAADIAFHEVIYQATQNPRLISILNNLREQIYRYRMEYLKDRSSFEKLEAEHQQIYREIVSGNKDAAKAKMCEHIDNQEKAILKEIRTNQ